MRIVCPSCGAAYEVPEERLVPGRMVRCARCINDWAPLPATLVPAPEQPRLEERQETPELPEPPRAEAALSFDPEPASLAAPSTEQRLAPPPLPRSRSGAAALLIGWVLTFAVLGAAAWAAYDRREDVMRAWPASERAYAALGIAPRR